MIPRPTLPIRLLAFAFALAAATAEARAGNSTIVINTTLGDIEIELFDSLRPVSVTNFLNYVDDGDYTDSFIHRSVPGFVIQGGGFTFVDGVGLGDVPTDDPFQDTPGPSNLRGTIAMAEAADFATSQWFINLGDNLFLDPNFTVFGQVTVGMGVVDAIAAVPIFAFPSPFAALPLRNFTFPDTPVAENFIFATIPEPSSTLLGIVAFATIALLRGSSATNRSIAWAVRSIDSVAGSPCGGRAGVRSFEHGQGDRTLGRDRNG